MTEHTCCPCAEDAHRRASAEWAGYVAKVELCVYEGDGRQHTNAAVCETCVERINDARIEAQNPGIDLDEVRRVRAVQQEDSRG